MNKEGYQTEFECLCCGKTFTLENLHYFGYDEGYRLCDDCFKKYKKIPNNIGLNAIIKNKEQNNG